jgi:hypothetical protein
MKEVELELTEDFAEHANFLLESSFHATPFGKEVIPHRLGTCLGNSVALQQGNLVALSSGRSGFLAPTGRALFGTLYPLTWELATLDVTLQCPLCGNLLPINVTPILRTQQR